jgi:hypothetical protein
LLLLKTIHGIEKHPQAANVCRFSLYLTLLDYVGRAPIERLIRAAGDEKFLPDLRKNIVSADAFAAKIPAAKYTHVVGNPPWPMSTGQKDRTNQGGERREESADVLRFAEELQKARLAFGHNRLSDLFTWLAVRRLAADGAAFLRYVNSSVLRYFASLFGASYLMDKAKFEKNDLQALPCPFTNVLRSWLSTLTFTSRLAPKDACSSATRRAT